MSVHGPEDQRSADYRAAPASHGGASIRSRAVAVLGWMNGRSARGAACRHHSDLTQRKAVWSRVR